MSKRYATIITNDAGQQEVSAIAQMEGAAPEVRSGDSTKVVPIPDGVLIGMIKGGPVDSVGGYGFSEGSQGAGLRSQAGVTKVDEPAKAEAKAETAKAKAAKE